LIEGNFGAVHACNGPYQFLWKALNTKPLTHHATVDCVYIPLDIADAEDVHV
jgi:hypothetical protein